MNDMPDPSKMVEAARLTRAGRLTEATTLIRRMLGGETTPGTADDIDSRGRKSPRIDAGGETIEDKVRPLLAAVTSAPPQLTRGIRETYDFTIGTERFHILVEHDRALPRSGPSPVSADVTVDCDVQTLLMLDAGTLTPAAARRTRGARIDGDADAVRRAFGIMRRPT